MCFSSAEGAADRRVALASRTAKILLVNLLLSNVLLPNLLLANVLLVVLFVDVWFVVVEGTAINCSSKFVTLAHKS